jgi:predicted nuclease of predicted toxin-antitoxin system
VKFLLDANMPRAAVAAVLARGHQAEHVRDTGLRDAADEQIAAYALASGAVLISRDLDFADMRNYPPTKYHGLVVLRLPDDSGATQVAEVLGRFLSSQTLVEQLPGHLAIVDVSRVRFRPALI